MQLLAIRNIYCHVKHLLSVTLSNAVECVLTCKYVCKLIWTHMAECLGAAGRVTC